MKDTKTIKKIKGNKKLSVLIFAIAALIMAVISYLLLGRNLTIILFTLIAIILIFIRLLEKANSKKGKRKILKAFLLIILSLGILGLLAGTAFIVYIVINAPSFDSEMLKEKQSTILYDSEGKEYAKLGTEIRENIEYDDISEILIDAIVATEDSRFFQHNGFDLFRFSKAALGQIAGNSAAGGGSTLTMQVVKNTFTDANADSGIKGIIRKFTDIYISIFELEKNYTKEEIIEFYVNNHQLGRTWGVQEASQYYFGKNACDLTLSEAALIAGNFKSPIYYNPYNYPKNAESRRNTVLYLMELHGYITNEERKLAAAIPVESLLNYNGDISGSDYQGYIDTVADEAQKKYGINIEQTAVLIYTNMVRYKQDAVNEIMNNDSYRFWKDEKIQGGTAVINSQSGKIEALGTGRHRNGKRNFNYATSISRQIGSTAKPLFDYGPGMEFNNWSTYTLFNDEKYSYSDGTSIGNFDGKYEGPITLRRALSNSRNVPALKAFQQLDNKKIVEFVTSIGITPEISNGYIHEAHSIGAFTGSNPLAMAGAYQIFSNGGYYYEPYTINKIVFRNTGEEETYSSPKQKIISDSTAYMITDVLKMVTKGYSYMKFSNDIVASKTGTTNIDTETQKKLGLTDFIRDYWTLGYTTDTVISVWIGYDEVDNKYKLKYSTDGGLRIYFFTEVAKKCLNHTNEDWKMPNSVVKVGVEKLSDPPALPSPNTPSSDITYELFKKGTEPTDSSSKYLKVNTPTGLSINKSSSSVKVTWNAVNDPGYVKDTTFGYYVYFNNEKLAFTTNTSYTIVNPTTIYGTYSVKAGYENTSTSISDAAIQKLSENKEYNTYISGSTTTTISAGNTINESLYNGEMVKLLENGSDITSKAKITVKISDDNGITYTTIPNDKAGVYKVAYTVSYDSYTGYCNNTIIIK